MDNLNGVTDNPLSTRVPSLNEYSLSDARMQARPEYLSQSALRTLENLRQLRRSPAGVSVSTQTTLLRFPQRPGTDSPQHVELPRQNVDFLGRRDSVSSQRSDLGQPVERLEATTSPSRSESIQILPVPLHRPENQAPSIDSGPSRRPFRASRSGQQGQPIELPPSGSSLPRNVRRGRPRQPIELDSPVRTSRSRQQEPSMVDSSQRPVQVPRPERQELGFNINYPQRSAPASQRERQESRQSFENIEPQATLLGLGMPTQEAITEEALARGVSGERVYHEYYVRRHNSIRVPALRLRLPRHGVPPPTTRSTSPIPQSSYTAPSGEPCNICLETLTSTESNFTTLRNCNHAFHHDCIKTWFQQGFPRTAVLTCPMCRQTVSTVVQNNGPNNEAGTPVDVHDFSGVRRPIPYPDQRITQREGRAISRELAHMRDRDAERTRATLALLRSESDEDLVNRRRMEESLRQLQMATDVMRLRNPHVEDAWYSRVLPEETIEWADE